ncbi:hypothetical protein HYQ44_020309 [Verticillium longisporum]|nr:hypothetical protein HYQ44_020309 [Verticillium longisporum]
MVDMTTGGVAKPMAGTLGSTDAATGAPQNLKGEAVENEAISRRPPMHASLW